MKTFTKLWVVSCLALALGNSGCTRYIYQPFQTQAPEVDKVYSQGRANLRSHADSAEVYAAVASTGERMLDVQLMVYNNSDREIDFNPENLLVSGYNNAGKKVPFRVFTAKEYIRRRNTRNALIAGAVIVGVVGAAIALDKVDGKPSGSGRNGSNSGTESAFDAAFSTLYWMPVPIGPVHRPSDALLRRHTLMPGETLQGIVKVLAEPGYTQKILIETPINGRYLKFVFGGRTPRW